jgi:hypothetical protein
LKSSTFQNGTSIFENGESDIHLIASNIRDGTAIPEITSEITLKNNSNEEDEDDDYYIIQHQLFGKKILTSTETWFVQTILENRIPISIAEQILAKVDLSQVNKYVFFKVLDIGMEKLKRGKINYFANWIVGALQNEQLLYNLQATIQ